MHRIRRGSDPLGLSCEQLNCHQALNEAKDLASYGRYYEYTNANGYKKVIVEHTADPSAHRPHTHAGQSKPGADPRTYDFKSNRYQKIINP